MILSYSRVSTIGQADDDSTSIDEQQRKIRAIASLRGMPEWELMQYVDVISGSIPLGQREQGALMLRQAHKGDFIVAVKLDRLFRSVRDASATIELLTEAGVHLILADISTEPVTANGAGKLFFDMMAAFAEFERGRIAERMVDGRVAKARRGGHIGGSAPYGWNIIGEGVTSTLVPNEAEQVIRRKILHLDDQKLTPTQIAHKLNHDEDRPRSNGYWQPVQIMRVLERQARLDKRTKADQLEVRLNG